MVRATEPAPIPPISEGPDPTIVLPVKTTEVVVITASPPTLLDRVKAVFQKVKP